MSKPVLRALESHSASAPILVFLFRQPGRRAYRQEIEYGAHVLRIPANRTLKFLERQGWVAVDPLMEQGRKYYSLTDAGVPIAEILSECETRLERFMAEKPMRSDKEMVGDGC